MAHPVLYSYRRCPYAMRARLGIFFSGIPVEQREIVFWDKPEPMLAASPKGTVPVLVLPDGGVIDESRDILQWALEKSGSSLWPDDPEERARIDRWIDENDEGFKPLLDGYKYPQDFPNRAQIEWRQAGEVYLAKLERALQHQPCLAGDNLSMADLAIFPFIRQFAHVDKAWFEGADYPALKRWLSTHLQSDYFKAVMKNRPVWQPGHAPLWVDEPELHRRDQFRKKAEAGSLSA